MTWREARDLVSELARTAAGVDTAARLAGLRCLEVLDGREWLLLDAAARSSTYAMDAPVSGKQGWLNNDVDEPTGLVAAVTSFHTDGYIRQRATHSLARRDGVVSAAAIAVRLLDHVPQVREEARLGLLPALDMRTAATVLSVLLAGQDRQYAPAALAAVSRALFEVLPAPELVETLLRTSDRAVRRWAFTRAHERDLLPADRLLSVVMSDRDQRLRAMAAEWLLPIASAQQLRELPRSNSVEARLVAVTRLPDDVLVDDELLPLLADRASRVREQARWRARRRGINSAAWYRGQVGVLGQPHGPSCPTSSTHGFRTCSRPAR